MKYSDGCVIQLILFQESVSRTISPLRAFLGTRKAKVFRFGHVNFFFRAPSFSRASPQLGFNSHSQLKNFICSHASVRLIFVNPPDSINFWSLAHSSSRSRVSSLLHRHSGNAVKFPFAKYQLVFTSLHN